MGAVDTEAKQRVVLAACVWFRRECAWLTPDGGCYPHVVFLRMCVLTAFECEGESVCVGGCVVLLINDDVETGWS